MVDKFRKQECAILMPKVKTLACGPTLITIIVLAARNYFRSFIKETFTIISFPSKHEYIFWMHPCKKH